jgi:Cdc6-like AAA superfamily ATPase
MMDELTLFPLSENWIPNKLLIRDKQLNTLLENVDKPFPSNFWITGDKGLGKTLTVTILSQIRKDVFVIKCETQSFKETAKKFALSNNIIPKATESPLTTIMRTLEAQAKSKVAHVIFDDVDKLQRYFKRDFALYAQGLYDALLTEGYKFSIHVITTLPFKTAEKIISSPAMSRLKFKPLLFPRYSKHEITTLLKQRLQFIEKLIVEEEAVEEIAEITSRIGGDFRKALEITRNAIVNKGALTLTAVKEAWEKEKTSFWKDQITNTPFQAAMLLACIVEETVKVHGEIKGDPPYFPVSWGCVKNRYRRRCQNFNVSPQNDKMLYYWLEQLWLNGWVEKFTLSKKHEWNYTHNKELYIRLNEKLSNLIPAIKEINWSEEW